MLRTSALAFLLLFSLTAAAAEKGFFGYALRTEFDGSFWNPVLTQAVISVVAPGSPTERAGVAVDDIVLEIAGMPLPGARKDALKKLKAALDAPVQVGDRRHMRLRRPSGEEYAVTLVAEPRKE